MVTAERIQVLAGLAEWAPVLLGVWAEWLQVLAELEFQALAPRRHC
jgi:hypothetical protein